MKRKVVSILLCLAMTLSLAAGCGKSDGKNDKDGKELLVWVPALDDNTEKLWTPMLEEFEKENDCEIDLEIIPWENYGSITNFVG